MSRFVIDMPDDFKNEMLRFKARTGVGFRYQVLTALRERWGWDESTMPIDARYAVLEGDIPAKKTNGHTPKNVSLDAGGLPEIEPGMQRADYLAKVMEAADKAMGAEKPQNKLPAEVRKWAVHPEDEYYKTPNDEPFKDADAKAIIGELRGDEQEF